MKAIQKIREEHRSISAVLHGLKQLARDAQNAGVKPEFAVFRAMIHYIDEFPEQLHHPKEDKYLFPPLAARVRRPMASVRICSFASAEGRSAGMMRRCGLKTAGRCA